MSDSSSAPAAARTGTTLAPGLPRPLPARNPGMALDLHLVAEQRVNPPAVERDAAAIATHRPLEGGHRAAWLVRAVTLIDLTTLAGDDTPGRVRRLCAKARHPVRAEILEALGAQPITTAAVCVYHEMIPTAVAALEGTGLPVAAVSTGFPHGLSPLATRIAEIRASVEAGAREIDIVISRRHVLTGDWRALHHELLAFREACGPAHMKAILATGELGTLTNVARASWVAMMAGADFIKTSTGKEAVNATLPVSLVMVRAIRDYHALTGHRVGFKPAGGISTGDQALAWLMLMHEELGATWITPALCRFGASSLLGDIERQLEEHVTGRPSAAWHHPAG